MKLLHTSDWHLGRMLYAKKERSNEHIAFLEWLLVTIKKQAVEALIVAGDIFDTATPSSSSQKIYYDFLLKVHDCGCHNIIIVGGNHDSPSFLNAPKQILSALNVSVIGNTGKAIEDEVLVINDKNNEPAAIICAVPFLRERDISRFSEGETYSDRTARIAGCIKNHYAAIANIAEKKRKTIGKNIPIIATGHLSITGGKTTPDDGVRETYIGTIGTLGSDIFPAVFDYVALGHYHIPCKISEKIRYCGSPIPMGFGEAGQQKRVYILEFKTSELQINSIDIPVFQRMESIVGDKAFIAERLKLLKAENISVWVDILYNDNEIIPDLSEWINEQLFETKIEVLKLQSRQLIQQVLTQDENTEMLENLNKYEVFDKLLVKNDIQEKQKEKLKILYNEIVISLEEEER